MKPKVCHKCTMFQRMYLITLKNQRKKMYKNIRIILHFNMQIF